ncbi:7882_t:CDS:2, partial [Funneliformis geosporum]
TRVPRSKVYTRTIQIDDDLLQYIDTFSKDSTKEIREALYFPHPRPCENSSPLIDFAYKHVRSTVNDCMTVIWARLCEWAVICISIDILYIPKFYD